MQVVPIGCRGLRPVCNVNVQRPDVSYLSVPSSSNELRLDERSRCDAAILRRSDSLQGSTVFAGSVGSSASSSLNCRTGVPCAGMLRTANASLARPRDSAKATAALCSG